MAEVYKKFLHNGPRTEVTDRLADRLARHAVLHSWPEATDLAVTWVQHEADWLVYATGTIPDKEGTT